MNNQWLRREEDQSVLLVLSAAAVARRFYWRANMSCRASGVWWAVTVSAERSRHGSAISIATDIGGTFTDVAAFDASTGRLRLGKTLTTPRSLVEGIEIGVQKAQTRFPDASLFLHGTTVAINAILERTGARTALVTTEGFRDVYEIGRVNRPDSYNLFFSKHRPLVPRDHRYEISERLLASGEILKSLDEEQVRGLAAALRTQSVEAVAILPALLLQSSARTARESDPPGFASGRFHFRLTRAVARVPRVRAVLDRCRQCLCRTARTPISRRDRTADRRAWL